MVDTKGSIAIEICFSIYSKRICQFPLRFHIRHRTAQSKHEAERLILKLKKIQNRRPQIRFPNCFNQLPGLIV